MAKALSQGEQRMRERAEGSRLLGRKWIGQMNISEGRTDKHTWTRRWGVLAAALIAALVVGSLLAVLQLARTNDQQEGGAGKSKQTAPVKQPAEQTFPGMYLGAGNQVIKLDMQTHKVLWRFVIKSNPNDIAAFQQPQVHYAPSVVGGSVYFEGGNGRLYALNAQTGAVRWTRNFQQELWRPYIVDGVLYISTNWNDNQGNAINDVYAINLADGTTKMKYKDSGSIAGIFDGVMYLSSSHELTAIRVVDGSKIWQTQINAKTLNENVYVKNGVLYASSDDGHIYTFDLQSGKITWQSPAINDIVFDIAVGDDGRVYFGAQNHYVYAFDPKANREVWQYHTIAGHVYPAPIVLNGVVYVGQDSAGENGPNNDHLVALDAATGKQKWSTPLIGYTGSGDDEPLVLYNGVIYLSTGRWNNRLLGFAADSGKQVVSISMDTLLGKSASKTNFPMAGIAITIVS